MTISLRNLPPEVEKAIVETSRREGISLNKATLQLLQTSLHKPVINTDLDEFFGTWSDAEADEFDAALAEMRKIDPADWEPFEWMWCSTRRRTRSFAGDTRPFST